MHDLLIGATLGSGAIFLILVLAIMITELAEHRYRSHHQQLRQTARWFSAVALFFCYVFLFGVARIAHLI
jgi:hypothetical protein